jgi:hypothetical protein
MCIKLIFGVTAVFLSLLDIRCYVTTDGLLASLCCYQTHIWGP